MVENTAGSVQAGAQVSSRGSAQSGAVIYPEMDVRIRESQEKEQRNKRLKRKVLKVLAWTFVVAIVAFLVLFISSKVGQFESIADMLDFISRHFAYADLFRT